MSTGLALALASSVLLPLLGHKLLTDWDEGIYAEVSREMLGGGWRGWIVPHWNGKIWFDKPPLTLWITAVFFRVFGVTEFWARAGSALSGVAIVGVLHGWMARRTGWVAAWIGTVALLSTTGFLHICRVGETDTLLSFGCVVSLVGLVEVAEERSAGWYLFWVGFAVAAMAKGAGSVILPLTCGMLALLERWNARRFGRAFAIGCLGFLLLVAPWHLTMWRWYGPEFTDEYFGYRVLTRATQAIEGHHTRWWFYGKVLLVSAWPWVLIVPVAIARCWRRAEMRVWSIFAMSVVGFYTVVRSRLPHYVAPAYPAMAVVVAVFLAGEWERARRWPMRRRIAILCTTMAIWGGGLMLTAAGRKRLHSAEGTGGWTAAEEREAVGLLRGVDLPGRERPILTWWTETRRPVATCIFYARRVVEQVQAEPVDPAEARNRYTFDPRSLDAAVGKEPATILLETRLVAEVPPEFLYRRLRAGPTMEIGTIQRR